MCFSVLPFPHRKGATVSHTFVFFLNTSILDGIGYRLCGHWYLSKLSRFHHGETEPFFTITVIRRWSSRNSFQAWCLFLVLPQTLTWLLQYRQLGLNFSCSSSLDAVKHWWVDVCFGRTTGDDEAQCICFVLFSETGTKRERIAMSM